MSPEEFELIADSAPVPMWVTKLDRKRSFANRAYVEFLGLPYEQAIDFDWRTILHPDDADRVVRESIAGEATLKPFTLNARYRNAHGEWRWIRSVSQPRFDAEGHHTGFIGVAHDITEVTEAEQRARESEAQLSAFFSQSAVGLAQVDLTGRFTLVNDRFCEITGRSSGELYRMTMQSITHPDDLGNNVPLFERAVRDGTPYAHEKRYIRPDGSIVWVNNSVAVIRRADGEPYGVLAVALDVTARRTADEALRRSEQSMRLAMEGGGMATVTIDLHTMTGEWSANRFDLLGLPRPADDIGSYDQWLDRVHPDDVDRVRKVSELCFQQGTPFRIEYRIRRADTGELRWIQSHGSRVGGAMGRFVGVSFDVTERRQAQEALAALNSRLEHDVAERTAERDNMWRLSRDLFLVVSPRWAIRAVNPAVRAFGYAPEDVVGRRFADFLHPDDLREAQGMLRSAARGAIGGLSARLRDSDGIYRLMSWSAVPGENEAYVIGRDITDEVSRRDELEVAQDALRQAQKVESLGQLTGGVAHDFNNLLTPIIGSLDLLRRRTGDDETRELRLINAALESAERARVLVQRLLAFARQQPLDIGPVDIGKLVEGMAVLIGSTAGPLVEVRVDIASRLPAARADANQLELALLNLGVNARDAMPKGGTLTLTADLDGDFIRVAVTDTGEGMDEATMARAVEPFFSTKGVGKGTGLGLSMVHGLAAQLGGEFRLDSRVGQGTTVELLLPIAEGLAAAREDSAARSAGGYAGDVLLVDDEEAVRTATADMLTELGFTVVQAANGEEALAQFDLRLFDLLVTDHMMPGMTGAALAHAAHDRVPRILIISGFAELDQIPSGYRRLAKPFNLTELDAALDAMDWPARGA
jgi:PAS domain S-box-containing protein